MSKTRSWKFGKFLDKFFLDRVENCQVLPLTQPRKLLEEKPCKRRHGLNGAYMYHVFYGLLYYHLIKDLFKIGQTSVLLIQKKNIEFLQYGRSWKEATSSKILWVLEHEKKIKVSNKNANKLHNTTENQTNRRAIRNLKQCQVYLLLRLP